MAIRLITRISELCAATPEATVIERTTDGACWTRGEVLAEAGRLAHVLDQETPTGATIAIESRPEGGAEFIASLLATWGSGRRALPIASTLPREESDLLLEAHRPAASIGQTAGDSCTLECAFGAAGAHAQLDRGSQASLLLQSSGTIGRGRVALRGATAIDNVASTLLDTLHLEESDHVLSSLPMHHAYGIEHAVLLPLLAGARVLQMEPFALEQALELLGGDVTVLPTVPPTIEALARERPTSTRLRLVYTAGTSLSPVTAELFERTWNLPVGDLYGATEIGTITFGFHGACTPVRGVEVIVGSPGTGEILVRSDAMFSGYLDRFDSEPVLDRTEDGYFKTGDLGTIDQDGSVVVQGRLKLEFDVGGLKINPTDLENVLREHPGVLEIVILPLKLSDTVVRVHAFVVPVPGIHDTGIDLTKSLHAFARDRLASHQVPRVIELVDDFPRTPSGKILRSRLLKSMA